MSYRTALTHCAVLAGLFLVLSCHTAPGGATGPVGFNREPYQQPGETVGVGAAADSAVYHLVLEFYRPGPGQSRWLDRVMLPAGQSGSSGMLDSALAAQLVRSLGPGFCLLDASLGCPSKRGGMIRLSPPYGVPSGQVRVVARYEGIDPHAPDSAYFGTQIFVLDLNEGAWRIVEHGPALPSR